MKKAAFIIVNLLPLNLVNFLRKLYFFQQIKNKKFVSSEPEYNYLINFVKQGDTVIDVGANVGRYCLKLSEIVGEQGNVIAFEPMIKSFENLTYFVNRLQVQNITLLNLAASDETTYLNLITENKITFNNYIFDTDTRIKTSKFNTISDIKYNKIRKLAIKIDDLNIPKKVSLVKIDVEGNEFSVIKGMEKLILRDHPILIIERNEVEIDDYIINLGYKLDSLNSSSSRNSIFTKI